ncbi:CHAT domain-containing protein [Streptomyces sp. IMTB 1903]|uniref:CHAT domain-containing protein n=1 Tax=Streptomyces sp. IMTB 1903 TaxID=1776680 RepID=UPI000757EBCD|nr:CHAT domain-containing protein [Streptomyces sp. IMTB 1903]
MIQPPYLGDHLCRWLHLAVGTVPLLLWARDPSASGVAGLVLALLLLGRIALYDLRLRVFIRMLRGRERLKRVLVLLLSGGALALWPADWLAGAGAGEGAAGAVSWASVGWASALLLVTALGCLQEWRTWPDVRGVPSCGLQPFWAQRRLLGCGWGPALLAVTHPGVRGLLLPAIAVTAAELAFSGYAARTGDWQLRVVDALRLPLQPSFRVPWVQGSAVGSWAYDSVVRRPRRPDLAPWELMLRHNEVLAGSVAHDVVVRTWQANATTPTADAEPWVSTAEAYADSLKALFQYQAGTEIPPSERRALFATWQAVAAMTAMARAEVSAATGLLDNAVRNRRYAAELFAAAGLPLNAAAARCLTADLLAFQLSRPDEALAEVDEMGDRAVLPPALQRLAELVEGVAGRAPRRAGGDRRRPSALLPGAATALFEELPSWLPFLSVHHREIAFVRHVEQRADNAAHLSDRQPDVTFPGIHRGFAGRYRSSAGDDLRQVMADAQRSYAHGSFDVARRAAMDVLEAARSANDLAQQTAALRLLARTAAGSRNWAEQYAHLIALVASVETARDRVADADLRIDLDLAQPCAELVALIVDRRVPGVPLTAALDVAERGRARVMLQTLGGVHEAVLPAGLRELQEKEKGLLQSVRSGDGIGSRGPYGFAVLNPYWGEVERAKLEEIWRAMEATGAIGAAYVSGRRGAPAEFAQLRAMLEPGEVLCEFVHTGARTIVLLVRRDRPEPVVVDLRLTARSLLPGKPDAGRQAPSWVTELAPLAQALAAHTRPGEVLWLVPEGPLHDLPLHAVTFEGIPWGERNPMSCTPSASLMRYRLGPAAPKGSTGGSGRGSGNGTGAALVLADSRGDLVHARAEARAIRAVLPSTEVHTGASATLRTLRERLSQARYDVVHLACHCRLDGERPSRSGILLADGELTAEDLHTVRLDVRLVVLSGCDTGAQEQRRGNELMGLTRQFLHAGARSVLVTRWRVDDVAGALLMEDFYRRLKQGSPLATALSAARHRVRTMTLEQALEHCERERRRTADPDCEHSLSHDIARLRLRAGDVGGALEEIEARLADACAGSAHRRRMLVLRERARYASPRRDHHLPAFDHPYYWAPFTLVGDWR